MDTDDLVALAERKGLRLAIACRTVAFAVAFSWIVAAWATVDQDPYIWSLIVLGALTAFGVAAWWLSDARYDVWWAKYALYAVDVLAVCSLFAFFPVSRGADVPQIVAFRAYGIYFLFPFIALACLSLSWRLVAWTGCVAVVGWWSAFLYVVSDMERVLSWGDMAVGGDADIYASIFMSLDFIGIGNRIQESGLTFIAAMILAIAVYRARTVFRAQLAAENERERVARTFGRFVPPAVAQDLIEKGSLEPQRTRASVLVLDIAGFTAFSETRDPASVTNALNGFLTRASRAVAEAGGTVISFTGDGLLATFGAPIAVEVCERAAVRAALALDEADVRGDFAVRVGIATGEVATGSIGAEERQAFTVYGRTVNLAARLEGAAKTQGAKLLMDEATAKALSKDEARFVAELDVRGMDGPVRAWTPVR